MDAGASSLRATSDDARQRPGLGLPIVVLAAAQFLMVLDSSVMNVSISQIVEDLDTSIQGVQLAITAYTLVMAAFILAGAKLGDVLGRDRAFAIGLAIYGVGSLTTALSPNLGVLLVGWSLIEGLGAALVLPAIVSLIAGMYTGPQRALAYGIVGGVAGAAVAAGPIIGGWVTTNLSWRYVFAAESVVVVGILLARGALIAPARTGRRPRLDVVGVGLSASGLALVVLAILKSSEWGLVQPRGALEIGGTEITPLGFSVVPFLIALGLGLLYGFARWEDRRTARGLDVLVDRTLLQRPVLRAGVITLSLQQLVLMGTFFVLPVYLQVVLGLDAFETGKRLFPMSVTMVLTATLAPKLAAGRSPRQLCRIGLLSLAAASLVLVATIDVELNGALFAVALGLFGVGAGLLASQLGNAIMSAVETKETSEAGGLQGTAQNLGASLGTAVIGAVLLAALSTGVVERVSANPDVPPAVRQGVVELAQQGVPIVSVDQVRAAATDAGLTGPEADALADDYGEAQITALKQAILAVAGLALLSLVATRRLPDHPLSGP